MGSMSWSDDTRCLYCDGRLPLYRKITHGQFCSSAHRKAYWKDQEELAVERLNQTHHSLRVHRAEAEALLPQMEPAAPAETPAPELNEDTALSLGGPVPQNLLPQVAFSPDFVAADPLEYEILIRPERPSHASSEMALRLLPAGEPVHGWEFSGGSRGIEPAAAAWEIVPAEAGIELTRPTVAALRAERNVPTGAWIKLSLGERIVARAAVDGIRGAVEALESSLPPVTDLKLEVAPQSDVLEQLLEQEIPHPDRMFALAHNQVRESRPSVCHIEAESVSPQPEALIAKASLRFTPDTAFGVAGLRSLPVEVTPAAAYRICASDTQVMDLNRGDAPEYALATPPRGPSLKLASSQLALAGAPGYRIASVTAEPAGLSEVSVDIALPERRTFSAAGVFVPMSVDVLAPLPYAEIQEPAGKPAAIPTRAYLFPQPLETQPLIPQSKLEPLDAKPVADELPDAAGDVLRATFAPPASAMAARKHPPIWSHAVDFWQHAPRDLKLLLFAIPALIALVFHPSLPKVSLAAPRTTVAAPSQFRKVLDDGWSNVRQSVLDRAAIALNEDFHGGLDNWVSPGGSTTEWSFDQTGFVRPGPLALYRPSIGLTDYQAEMMGAIDKKALSWVVRASNFQNYYVIKLVVLKPGPIPIMGITRYAVINGKAQDRADTLVPISARPDMLYRVTVNVHGPDFSLAVQGQMVDSWSEPRLDRGGVGLFSALGEQSRVLWVQVTHQYDMLGRLCAYLAPYQIPSTTGSWQQQ
jgi:hypothetical protein